jgi:hypothetical protein
MFDLSSACKHAKTRNTFGLILCELAPGTGMRDATRNEALPAGWDMSYSVRRFYMVRLILELPE